MKPGRAAFSLYALLVVLAILVILLGLLAPAVARMRGEAARVQSRNNLRQLSLACINYAATYGPLPAGDDDNHFSAAARLLPFLEEDNLYKSIDFKKPVDDEANAKARKTRLKVFENPLDPVTETPGEFAGCSYLYCAGSRYSLKDNDGVVYRDSKVKTTEIKDGLDHTLLIGETLRGDAKAPGVKRQHVRLGADALKGLAAESGVKDFADGKHVAADRCGSWMDGRFLQGTFTATLKVNDERPDVDCGGAGGLSGLRGLKDTVNACFCDGSVRVLNADVKLELLKAMATRAGGEPVELP
jgi:prepilin-type processing-associated H-X9-DG protein